ncbi:MAG: DNA polymerase III subunit delta [Aestuariibacter sp.]
MQVYANQYPTKLQSSLAAFHLIFGDEPQQKLESIDLLRQTVKAQGFTERQSLVVDNQFEWHQLLDACQSMSLFAERQYIELELPTGKPGTEGSKTLMHLAEQANPDVILLVHGPKVGKDVQNTKWFKTLDKQGYYVPCYELEGNRLFTWMRDKLNQYQLPASPDIVGLFVDYYEGNLLAAVQEMQKLSLLPEAQRDSRDRIEPLLLDQSRFNVFQLSDLVLAGNSNKMVKLLYRLESEGVEPTMICWQLAKEWMILNELSQAQQRGVSQDTVFKTHRIWQSKQALYLQAINRLSSERLTHLGTEIASFDSALKSSGVAKPYVALCHLCLLFAPIQIDMIQLSQSYV